MVPWTVHEDGYIRAKGPIIGFEFCPLTYAAFRVDGYMRDIGEYIEAGEVLGFNRMKSDSIMAAADSSEATELWDTEETKLRRIFIRLANRKTTAS